MSDSGSYIFNSPPPQPEEPKQSSSKSRTKESSTSEARTSRPSPSQGSGKSRPTRAPQVYEETERESPSASSETVGTQESRGQAYEVLSTVVDNRMKLEILSLLYYMRRSLTCVLGVSYQEGVPLYYLGDLRNNSIVAGPFSKIECLFDSRDVSVFEIVSPVIDGLAVVDALGNVTFVVDIKEKQSYSYVLAGENSRFEFKSFLLGGVEMPLPDDSPHPDAEYLQNYSGSLVMETPNGVFLINSEYGAMIGTNFSYDPNGGGSLYIRDVEYLMLARRSPNLLIVREVETQEEMYIIRNGRTIVPFEYGSSVGGVGMVRASEESTDLTLFNPSKIILPAGSTGILRKSPYFQPYNNGFLHTRGNVLITDFGVTLYPSKDGSFDEYIFGSTIFPPIHVHQAVSAVD